MLIDNMRATFAREKTESFSGWAMILGFLKRSS